MLNTIACFLSLASCVLPTPPRPADRPAVLIVVSRGNVQMQEFSSHLACAEAVVYVKAGEAGPQISANCVAK